MRNQSLSVFASKLLFTFAVLPLSAFITGVARADDAPKPGYESGLPQIRKLAKELHVALESRKQQAVQPEITLADSIQVPYVGPARMKDGQAEAPAVHVSPGFIRFVNSLSHAKALGQDGVDVIKSYAARVAAASLPPSVTDGMAPEKAWEFDVMNVQAGQFNQMAGALVAIDFAHHYLGHYKKYSAQMIPDAAGTLPPIGNFTTEREWREAVLKGTKNALDCGLGVDGLKTLFEFMEATPSRPAWCAYFVPPKVNLSKLSRELKRLESDFFLVDK
jgi:hypothetical protein